MGASGWFYFVPYQSKIDKALQELREEVFKNGKYGEGYSSTEMLSGLKRDAIAEQFPEISAEEIEKIMRELQELEKMFQLPKRRKPKTIAALLKQSGEEGTHSILDIQGVSETPDIEKVSPLPSAYLIQFFGTEKPNRELAKQKINAIQDLCGRWQGFYLIIFQNDVPYEILFAGVSGD